MQVMGWVFLIVMAVAIAGVLIVREVFKHMRSGADSKKLIETLGRLEQVEMENARLSDRVAVLETIVTDRKTELKEKIDSLD